VPFSSGRRSLVIVDVTLMGLCVAGFALGFGPMAKAKKIGGTSVTYSTPAGTPPVIREVVLRRMRVRLEAIGARGGDARVSGATSIEVFLPKTVKDPARVLELLGATARLEEREVLATIPPVDPVYLDAALTPTNRLTGGFMGLGDEVVTYEDTNQDHEFTDGTDVKYRLGKVEITHADLKNATAEFVTSQYTNVVGGWMVMFTLNEEGARKFAEATSRLVGKQLAIVVDGVVRSAPTVQSPITGGKGEITGSFTETQAKVLAAALDAGALPVALRQGEAVDATRTRSGDRLNAGTVVGAAALVVLLVLGLLHAFGRRGARVDAPARPDEPPVGDRSGTHD
jgi:preprotein translocase subunit SecD